jgi:hypothetical protein
MTKNLIEKIVAGLINDTSFDEYKFRKKDSCLIKRTEFGYEAIELQSWEGYDLTREKEALIVKPLFLKRFDVLHRWFEKYSFKSKQDQRNNYSIGFDGKMLNRTDKFYFLLNEESFETDFEKFRKEALSNSQYVFSHFASLEDLYKYYIDPVLKGEAELPNIGADWIFEYLTIAKFVNNDSFGALKKILEKWATKMYENREPNIVEYYSKFQEIVEYLDCTELQS